MPMIKVSGPAGMYDVPVHRAPIGTRILQGAGLGGFLTLFRLFAYRASSKDFSLAQFALLFGAVIVGSGIGGAAYYATDWWRVHGGWRKTLANVVTLLVYCFATLAVVGLVYWLTNGAIFDEPGRGA